MLPIRPVRGMKRYEEHLDFYRFTLAKKLVKERSMASGEKGAGKEPSFPYAREAEIDSAEQFAKAVAAMLMAAAALKSIVEELGGQSSASLLERRIVQSSEPDAVKARAEPGAPIGGCTIQVRQLAAAQLNRTAYFAPDAPTTAEYGRSRVRFVSGDKTLETEWFISAPDTHRSVLARFRSGWNDAQTGVRAALETDPATGRIRLVLEGQRTGAAGAFFLQDLTGNLASATGLLVKDRLAADAQYRVNGGSWSVSGENRISLPEARLHLELLQLPAEPVVLSVLPDISLIQNRLRDLDRAMDGLEQELAQSAEYINPVFAATLGHIRAGYQPAAFAALITIHFGEATSSLLGENGLIARLRRFLARMEAGPAEDLLNRGNSRYKRYANYLSSLEWYSQLPSQGLLMNRFF